MKNLNDLLLKCISKIPDKDIEKMCWPNAKIYYICKYSNFYIYHDNDIIQVAYRCKNVYYYSYGFGIRIEHYKPGLWIKPIKKIVGNL